MERVVFLVDMNAFYISCERTRHPEIEGKPAAVAGDPINRTGIILTANYEARKYGIKTTMVVREALKLCPNLIIIPPDHQFYEQKSKEVMKILASYTPLVEQNSIDEAWLDMTGCSGIFGEPVESAKNIMERIKTELGLWCSIGISENKFLSKMASEMKKPLGITELWKKDIKQKMWPLPVNYMYGVGKQTAQKLQNHGIKIIRDLALADKEFLLKILGRMAVELSLLANGIDTSLVTPNSVGDMKSIGRSTTLPHDTLDIEYAKAVLFELSDDVGMTARKYGKKGHTVQINIKYSDFKSITRQITIPETFLVKDIYTTGVELLKKNWNNKPIRLLGISLSGFDGNKNSEQISLFELPVINEKTSNKIESVENTIHNIRQKYGSSIIKPGIIIRKENKN
ncbi:DNA polymerase-4 [Sedimentibacter acidaminivorans]|uniref:DNA polymerase IV n=1 Tax=Sedimentibacter acidaminivorans TaxID=913099 RepID=A0ABS4GBX6_9FIRM|nr:DNA polymerase IV [Sedimentibacter acidaminivorans]MBP1925176.1 DNA polymerase-4 [Sedimentibacter acidaminivorans]